MTKNIIDKATKIREGEELNLLVLQNYLKQHLKDAPGELSVDQFPGGASNLTYLIRLGEKEMVLRRPPFGANVKSGHDMGREFRVLSALADSYNKAPKPLLYCEDESVLGAPFYIMERVKGVILRGRGDQAGSLPPSLVSSIADSMVDTMVELHNFDYKKAGLNDLGKPQGYNSRQIIGWTKRYYKAKTDDHPSLEKSAAWLNSNIPGESRYALIHNDYKHDNMVLDSSDLTRVLTLLDWEMCTLGDPLMDLGTTLGYWINPNDPPMLRTSFPNPSVLQGNPTRGEFLEMYAAKSGLDIKNPVFYYVYGLFKIAVIVQQIYYRYKLGFTSDPRFSKMNYIVAALGNMAQIAIEKNQIDDLV